MGSPARGGSPISSRGGDVLDKDPGQNQCGKDYLYRRSDGYSSRNSDGHSTRHDQYRRREKHLDEEDRRRDLRKESEHRRSRGYLENTDKYSRDRYGSSKYRSKDKERELFLSDEQKFRDKDVSFDGAGLGSRHAYATSEDKDRDRDRYKRDKDVCNNKRGSHLSYRDRQSHRDDSIERDYRNRDSYKNDHKEPSGQKDMKKYDDLDTSKDKNRYNRAGEVQKENKSVLGSVSQESLAKRPKLWSGHLDSDYSKDVSEKEKQLEVDDDKASTNADHSVAANDLNAAKVAALKAAELVNRNLVGVGVMSTEQKKKLLWGNKKSTTSEVSAHRWDAALFDDHERREKFNKLMSLRLRWYLWPIVGCEGRCEGRAQLQHQ